MIAGMGRSGDGRDAQVSGRWIGYAGSMNIEYADCSLIHV